jgi:hypothetical protein
MLITKMNMLTLIAWICLSTIPALAQTTTTSATPLPCSTCRSGPAPLIGFGLPAALAVGGVLLGFRSLKRTRRS